MLQYLARKSTKEVYNLIEDALQLLSAVATGATFLRVIEDYQISKVFLLLPLLLLGYFITRKHPALKQDVHTMSMLAGAATGINSGFLSSIVVNKSWIKKMSSHTGADASVEYAFSKSMLLRHLEFLHFPVICGSLLYSYCIVFDQLPSKQSARLAASTALCGAVMITVSSSLAGQMHDVAVSLYIFMCMFFIAFLTGMLPAIKHYQRPWMICVIIFVVSIFWQSDHFDTLVWNWEECKYPIPGSVTSMILILLLNVHESGDTIVVSDMENLQGKEKHVSSDNSDRITDIKEVLMNAFSWHGLTFVIERISLAFINSSRKQHKEVLAHQTQDSDVWIACLTMAALVGVFSTYFRTSHSLKLTVILTGLMYYVTMTITKGILCNGYFIDMVLGLTIVYFCHNKYFNE